MARRVPRVYHAAAGPVGLRALTERRTSWRASNSGTATSATSRSTRSSTPPIGSLWMSTGVAGAIKRAGGDAIEFAAVRRRRSELGSAVVTTAGTLAARAVIHAVSLDRDRRTSGGERSRRAVRSAMARARENRRHEHRVPGARLGGRRVPARGGGPDHRATVRDELPASPTIAHVVFALRGAAAYQAFSQATPGGDRRCRAGRADEQAVRTQRGTARRACRAGGSRDRAARDGRSGRPFPRGEPAVPGARRERDVVLRPGAARRLRRRARIRQRRSSRTTPASSC